MKQLYFLLIVAVCFSSCFEDKGNYNYTENEQITITGIENSYSRLYLKERLKITPEVKSTDPGANFEYSWTIYSGGTFIGDTITQTLTLDSLVDWNPEKTYSLIFAARNKNTGLTTYKSTDFIVNTPFSRGWYVLKNQENQAELDLYTDDNTQTQNVITFVNNQPLEGKAEHLWYVSDYDIFDIEANAYNSKKTLFVLTDQNLVGLNSTRATIIQNYNNMFFEQPQYCQPTYMAVNSYCLCMVNNGQLYTLSSQSTTNGKFGTPKIVAGQENYYLSKYAYNDYLDNILVFDTVSSTFFTGTNSLNFLTPMVDSPETELSCTANNQRLLYMGGQKPYYGKLAFAVMQDKTSGQKRIARIDLSTPKKHVTIKTDVLTSEDKVSRAELHTMSFTEEVLYFVADGQLWARNVAGKDGAEISQFNIPAGERATFIKSVKYTEKNVTDQNYVILGTTNGTNYTIRFFAKTTAGNLNPNPEFTFPREGETASGVAADIIYLSPKLHSMNCVYSY